MINILEIKSKFQSSFNSSSGKFNPELLYEGLIDICDYSAGSPQLLPEITMLKGTGGQALETINVADIAIGTMIMVHVGKATFVFKLMNYEDYQQELPPYIIFPKALAEKVWVRTNVIYGQFTDGDLEAGSLEIIHDLSTMYVNLIIFDNLSNVVYGKPYAPTSGNEYNSITVIIGEGISETYHYIILF
jgi:hypothetical protein